MRSEGSCGRSAIHYSIDESSVLDGLLFGDDKPEIHYPSNYASEHDWARIPYLAEIDVTVP